MTPRSLAKEIAADIEERLAEYLREEERELIKKARAGVEIKEVWNGYEISIAGHIIDVRHDSSAHRWGFIFIDNVKHEFRTFFETSEKKGKEIIRFLQALQEAIKSSKDRRPLNEENLAEDQDEDSFTLAGKAPAAGDEKTFVTAEQDPVILEEENIGGE